MALIDKAIKTAAAMTGGAVGPTAARLSGASSNFGAQALSGMGAHLPGTAPRNGLASKLLGGAMQSGGSALGSGSGILGMIQSGAGGGQMVLANKLGTHAQQNMINGGAMSPFGGFGGAGMSPFGGFGGGGGAMAPMGGMGGFGGMGGMGGMSPFGGGMGFPGGPGGPGGGDGLGMSGGANVGGMQGDANAQTAQTNALSDNMTSNSIAQQRNEQKNTALKGMAELITGATMALAKGAKETGKNLAELS